MSEELKLDPENQYIGDLMILQVLADSEDVNDQEREVLLRWIENSQPPASRDAEVQRESRAIVLALRNLIANDAYAITFQTLGQYRTSLLNAIDAALKEQQ